MRPSISILIPAFNEEKNIKSAIDSVIGALCGNVDDYELLVINDGSTDRTGIIADELARQNPQVKVVHNNKNMGFGYVCQKGIRLASKEYIGWVPGDNGVEGETLKDMVNLIGKAEIIISYIINTNYRTIVRRILSSSFTILMNTVFRMKLKYYNGPPIYKAELIKPLRISSTGFAFLAELLVRLIKKGHSFIEVPLYIRKRVSGGSKALSLKSLISVSNTIVILIRDIYFRKKPSFFTVDGRS